MKDHPLFRYFRSSYFLFVFSLVSSCSWSSAYLLIVKTEASSSSSSSFTCWKQGHLRCSKHRSTTLQARKSNARRRGCSDVLHVEKGLNERGFHPIIGSDESGRGCIAGPVVAASCCVLIDDWSEYTPIEGVNDSKMLSSKERERIFDRVVSDPDRYVWKIAERSNQEIDDSNILLATMECFKESIEGVAERLTDSQHRPYSIVDGKKTPKLSVKGLPCRPFVKADANVYTVALASILAKVSRDRLAAGWAESYPEYGFDTHKGYAVPEHIEAIHRYGPCPIHRLSFKSLKGR